jgi:hypothetical protein
MAEDEPRDKGPKQGSRETEEERESRLLLITFLTTADPLLDRLLRRLLREPENSAAHRDWKHLYQIWNSARERLNGVVRSIKIGLSRTRRRALERVGMFGDSLRAKWDLLSFEMQEGPVKRVLKRLNSMLSSLSMVFPALHAIKEFKDHVEVTIEALREPIEIISFGDLLRPQRQ